MNAPQESTAITTAVTEISDYAATIQSAIGISEPTDQIVEQLDFAQFQIDNAGEPADSSTISLRDDYDGEESPIVATEVDREIDSDRLIEEVRQALDDVTGTDPSEAQPQSNYAKKRKNKKKGRQEEGAGDGHVDERKFAQLREHFEPVRKPRPVAALLASRVIGSILEDRHIPVAVEERDGVTYLNISLTTGATPIGKALDPFATLHQPVEIEMLGKFQCLGAVMFYMCGQFEAESEQELFEIREGLRTRSSGALSDYIRGVRLKQLAGTRLAMAHAYWEAISNSKWLSEQLISTGGIPIRAEYRTPQGEYRQSHYGVWLVPVIEAIRTALIEHADYPEFNISEDESLQPEEERRWRRR